MAARKPMPMMVPIVERAFQLGRSGEFSNLRDVAARLSSEGYLEVEEHMWCPLLREQLRCAMRAAPGLASRSKGAMSQLAALPTTTSAGARPSVPA